MDYKRIIIYAALALVGMSLWNAWQTDNARRKASVTTVAAAQSVSQSASGVPQAALNAISASSSTTSTAKKTTSTPASPAVPTVVKAIPKKRLITVHTNTLNVVIDTLGGNIVKLSLPKYPKSLKTPNDPFTLLNNTSSNFYIAQSGLTGPQGPDTAKGQVQYTTSQKVYNLATGQKQLRVDLRWKNAAGLSVDKAFIFKPNQYKLQVEYFINNQMKKAWVGNLYSQIKRRKPTKKKSLLQVGTYVGGGYYQSR